MAAIVISAFFIQDIAWPHPVLSSRNHTDDTSLAPAPFDRRHTLEDKAATSLILMIEKIHGIPVERLTLKGVEAVLSKAKNFLADNRIVFSPTKVGVPIKDVTIYVNPNLVLRYTNSDSPSESLPGFTEASQENLGVLVRHTFIREKKPDAPEQLELDFTLAPVPPAGRMVRSSTPSPAKNLEAAKVTIVKGPGAGYQSALKKLSKAYDKYIQALRDIKWLRSPDRKYYRARAAKKIGAVKLARDKADSEIMALLESISAMDWRSYKISDGASNDERLEYISLNLREISIRLRKMMEDGGALDRMVNLKSRLKSAIVPLLTDYLAKEKASHDAAGPKRLPGIAEFAEPLAKHAKMMIAISKMKRGDGDLIQEDGPPNGHAAIPIKIRKEIFVMGEKCAEIARQLRLLDRSGVSRENTQSGIAAVRPGSSGGVDLPERWTPDAPEISRRTDGKGRFTIAIPGYSTSRFNLGTDYGSLSVTLIPYLNDDRTTGFIANVNGKAIAAYSAADDVFGLFEETRALDEKGRFNFGGIIYSLDMKGKLEYSGKKIILKPYKGFDWASGFTVELNGLRVASYNKKAIIEADKMTGMYIAGMSAAKDTEKLTALHDLFIEANGKYNKDDTRILLSESLFTNGADESELVQARIALSSVLNDGYISIVSPEKIKNAATSYNKETTKGKLTVVLTKEDFDNKEIWGKSDNKEVGIKSSVLILENKLTGSNYLYLEGVIGLAQALMANNKQAIRRYYELMSEAAPSDEIMAKLDDDSQNNVAFAIRAMLKFRPITRMDPEDLNRKRISMENALIAA